MVCGMFRTNLWVNGINLEEVVTSFHARKEVCTTIFIRRLHVEMPANRANVTPLQCVKSKNQKRGPRRRQRKICESDGEGTGAKDTWSISSWPLWQVNSLSYELKGHCPGYESKQNPLGEPCMSPSTRWKENDDLADLRGAGACARRDDGLRLETNSSG